MTKYLIPYNLPESATVVQSNSIPKQVESSMKEWIKWKDKAAKVAGLEWGLPLQPVGRVASAGVTDSSSQVSGYSFMEADSKGIILDLLKKHPHLKRKRSFIDVLELLPISSM